MDEQTSKPNASMVHYDEEGDADARYGMCPCNDAMSFGCPAAGRYAARVSACSSFRAKKAQIPFWEKALLTLEEAAAYSGIGLNRLRKVLDEPECTMVFYVQSRRLIKRKQLDEWIDRIASC